MRFHFLAAGTPDLASSRLRVFALGRALADLGHPTTDLAHADVLVVQKRLRPVELDAARRARAAGKAVIYDVDDLDQNLWPVALPHCVYEMRSVAHAFTTCNPTLAAALRRHYGVRRVEVISDCVDYDSPGPVRVPLSRGRPLRVLWFGYPNTFLPFEKHIATLEAIPDVQVVATTTPKMLAEHVRAYPRVHFSLWTRETFVPLLQSCDLTCLSHETSRPSRYKSNNKMIASITWGVPALVSRTPEYTRTAGLAGVPGALFGHARELAAAVERLRAPEARQAYLDTAQEPVWKAYDPRVIAQRYACWVQTLLTEAQELAPTSAAAPPPHLLADLRFACWRLRASNRRLRTAREVVLAGLRCVPRRLHPKGAGPDHGPLGAVGPATATTVRKAA